MKHLGTTTVVIANVLFVLGASSSVNDYHFGSASFASEMWINNKAVFTKPVGVDVEFVTALPFDWVFADSKGKEVRTLHVKNEHGGWTGMNFASLGLTGDYSIGFRNSMPPFDQQIKQGDVHLK
jgi:hypothetical protein